MSNWLNAWEVYDSQVLTLSKLLVLSTSTVIISALEEPSIKVFKNNLLEKSWPLRSASHFILYNNFFNSEVPLIALSDGSDILFYKDSKLYSRLKTSATITAANSAASPENPSKLHVLFASLDGNVMQLSSDSRDFAPTTLCDLGGETPIRLLPIGYHRDLTLFIICRERTIHKFSSTAPTRVVKMNDPILEACLVSNVLIVVSERQVFIFDNELVLKSIETVESSIYAVACGNTQHVFLGISDSILILNVDAKTKLVLCKISAPRALQFSCSKDEDLLIVVTKKGGLQAKIRVRSPKAPHIIDQGRPIDIPKKTVLYSQVVKRERDSSYEILTKSSHDLLFLKTATSLTLKSEKSQYALGPSVIGMGPDYRILCRVNAPPGNYRIRCVKDSGVIGESELIELIRKFAEIDVFIFMEHASNIHIQLHDVAASRVVASKRVDLGEAEQALVL
jgi:hypothetical protein